MRAVSDTGAPAPDDAGAATNPKAIRRLAASGWTAGIVIACALMIPAPPTARLGAAGWAAGIGIQAVSLLARLAFARNRTVTPRRLLVITWLLPVDIAAMQWLAGGWAAPYHELLLLSLILGSAWMSIGGFVPFAAMVAALTLAPAAYSPDADAMLGAVTGLIVWLFVSTALAMLMARVRGQARLARRDALTKLGNRRALEERFAATAARESVLAIGDLNRFKEINDVHGHLAGDACLTAVGEVLSRHARREDQVFRWGGDEFAILLPATSTTVARGVFERLEAAVAGEVADPLGAPVEITFGWAVGAPWTDLGALTEAADAALRARKPASRRRAAA